ncbi:MAG: hypothetical protein J6X44_08935, partial [Thermoguttaceae bacterium]|nr:hypothetical protein [Thermoguttaceae bacterium]
VVCGGIGGGAQNNLKNMGLKLYGGVRGDADAAVAALLSGTLEFDPVAQCADREEGRGCGGRERGHSCGRGRKLC